ncbi:MAG: thiamine diphosphokinase, partial [Streptococcaceae bacterium]|nr:thiamine diphosphokinase [Streptococcaceae bacterium]
MKEIIIVSGGEFNGVVEYLRENKPADNKLFGVDRGALRLVDNGFTLDMAIGDFDSVTAEEFERIKQGAKRIHRTIPVKDDTDTELALKVAIETYPEEKYTLLGYAGGRMDHFLANLFMVTQPRFSNIIERLSLVDEQNTLTFLKPGKHKLASQLGFDYLSLIGIGK